MRAEDDLLLHFDNGLVLVATEQVTGLALNNWSGWV
jgi:hypothetical protein